MRKEEVKEDKEYQLYALCYNDQMIYKEFPYIISGEVLEEIVGLISAETLEQLDKFKDELFDGPSELKELFEKVGPRVFL